MQSHERKSPWNASNTPRAEFQNTNGFNSTPIELLMDRLSGVKQAGPDKWQARCPAHDDRSPSLAIKEGSDGTVLLKCWAGCSAKEIVEAIGLKLSDLFPRTHTYSAPHAPRYSARDVVQTVLFESTIVELGYRSLQCGNELSPEDEARIELAILAINGCREVVR